jgi:dethiobiotin synthetase
VGAVLVPGRPVQVHHPAAADIRLLTVASLGTLNHTALTLEALTARKLAPTGVVIGSWPRQPGIAELANLTGLQAVAGGPGGARARSLTGL